MLVACPCSPLALSSRPPGYDALGEFLIEAVRSGVEVRTGPACVRAAPLTFGQVRVRDALVKGANINYKCQAPTHPPIWHIGCMTPLMLAVHRNDAALVKLLLDKGADKRITNHLGYTALNYAKDDAMKALLA